MEKQSIHRFDQVTGRPGKHRSSGLVRMPGGQSAVWSADSPFAQGRYGG
jgi:hypothetical protein